MPSGHCPLRSAPILAVGPAVIEPAASAIDTAAVTAFAEHARHNGGTVPIRSLLRPAP